MQSAECSFELTGRELEALGGSLPRGAMVYGRQALMLTRNCPLANSPKAAWGARPPGCLTDRKRKRFPPWCAPGWDGELLAAELLNSVPLWLGDREDRLGNMGFRGVPVHGGKPCGIRPGPRGLFFDRNP